MTIRKATIEDIPGILAITKACALHMINNGIFQWNENYPNTNVFNKDLQHEELYVLVNANHKVIGSIVLSELMDEEYKVINWLTNNQKNLYIHRLAIHPNEQGKGYAQYLMNFAENFAKEHSFLSVRLDTFSLNERNNIFYQKRGYTELGDVYFPKQSEAPFHCYELVL